MTDAQNSGLPETSSGNHTQQGPHIALLTPYSGNNYGDGAIQDAMISNMRLLIPTAQFSGISLNCQEFIRRHLAQAYPLCTQTGGFYCMVTDDSGPSVQSNRHPAVGRFGRSIRRLRNALGKATILGPSLRKTRLWTIVLRKEMRHAIHGYRFVRKQNLIVASGGGQLDEEWGGPWGHPFSLFKWAVLARLGRVPFVFTSVGACKLTSRISRGFLSVALRLATYRSYRDQNSRAIATSLLRRARFDPVVPDLAFSLPSADLQSFECIRELAAGRTIVAISPIVFAKPGCWPLQDGALYQRYLQQLSRLTTLLLERNTFVVFVRSTHSDEKAISEILEHLRRDGKQRISEETYIPEITAWRDLVAVLSEVDFLVASRLHSIILGSVTQRPTVAISFDPKVDWVMEDLGQAEFLLQIRDFEAEDVLKALERMNESKEAIIDHLRSYKEEAILTCSKQYIALADLALGTE